jgi:hypothetical protein
MAPSYVNHPVRFRTTVHHWNGRIAFKGLLRDADPAPVKRTHDQRAKASKWIESLFLSASIAFSRLIWTIQPL